jgi:DNA-directed RNA polymerase specialized sigma24 family protein
MTRFSRRLDARGSASSPEGFESFYKDVRERLLLQTYALTGDLHAAERAVRDSLVVAWHHWRKVARLDHPEDYVRPLAWARAQRRSSTRWWSRAKGIDPEVRATLDALGKLTTTQRKVLLLTHLTSLSMDQLAREAGITRSAAERELQTATAQFSIHREVASTAVRATLDALAPTLTSVRWPRPSILMRAGSARRRLHTTAGAAAVVAALVVSGSLVSDAAGVRPALADKGILQSETPTSRPASSTPAPPPPDPLTESALLTSAQLEATRPAQWVQGETTGNTDGDGLAFQCQGARYADSRGIGALLRTFSGTLPKAGAVTAGQMAEASADVKAAESAYDTALGWYAGCATPRVQLLSTHRVRGVGDEATMLVLRNWTEPVTTQVVGLARTGALTTTVVDTRTGVDKAGSEPDLAPSATLLADAVTGLCTLPDHGGCEAAPQVADASPVPVGRHPSLLIEADLPPVPGIDQPWVGTDPVKARENVAATRCDQTSFAGPEFTKARTRSFVVPAATDLPPEFGLTETVGALPRQQAQAFVDGIRDKLAACPDQDLGTDVEELSTQASGPRDLTVWRLTVEVSERRSVRYLMAVVREGNAVAQLTFVPSGDTGIGTTAFQDLAERAQQRLGQLTAAAQAEATAPAS